MGNATVVLGREDLVLVTDPLGISWSAIIVVCLWIAREVGARLISDFAERSGRVGYIRDDARLVDRMFTSDGKQFDTLFIDPEHAQGRSVRFVTVGHLFNESGIALVLNKPIICFWGVEGMRIRYVNPRVLVDGSSSFVVTVPPHGATRIGFDIAIDVDALATTYLDAIAVLELDTTDGRYYRFPLSGPVWRGDSGVVAWDATKNRVVRAGTKEWMRAQASRSFQKIESRSARRRSLF